MAIEITNACPEGNVSRPVTLTSPVDLPNQKGNPVIVPEGFFISDVSQEDADAQAEAFARQFLVCGYEHSTAVVLPLRTYVKDPFGGEETYRVTLDAKKSRISKDAVLVTGAVYKQNTITFDDPDDAETEIVVTLPPALTLPDNIVYLADAEADHETEQEDGAEVDTIADGFSVDVWFLRSVIGFSETSEEEAEEQAASLSALEMQGVYCCADLPARCPGNSYSTEGKTFCDAQPLLAVMGALSFVESSQYRHVLGKRCSVLEGRPLYLTFEPHYSWAPPDPDIDPPIARVWVTFGTVGNLVVKGDGITEVGVLSPIPIAAVGVVHVWVEASIEPGADSFQTPTVVSGVVKYGATLPSAPEIDEDFGFVPTVIYNLGNINTIEKISAPGTYNVVLNPAGGANLALSIGAMSVASCQTVQYLTLVKV